MANLEHVYVVILAGGGGTRLWPKSRENTPKQFLKLYTEQTLLQDTYKRARMFVDPAHILIISNKKYEADVREQLPEIPSENIIGEPAKRETGPAMLLGAMLAYAHDKDAVLINLASDHIATNEQEFQHVLETATTIANEQTSLVTVGITPTFPHSGLGYIRSGEKFEDRNGLPIYKVESFTEKPTVEKAKEFIATGKYYWNACNYVWGARTLFAAFEKYSPEIYATMKPIIDAVGTDAFRSVLETSYEKVEKIAIDYAISEKADNLVLIPGNFGWNDIGDWSVVHELRSKSDDGNAIMSEVEQQGEVALLDSHNNLIHTHDRLIALVGVDDTIVVDTGEILLVMPKSRSQDVKKIVEQLKEQKKQYL